MFVGASTLGHIGLSITPPPTVFPAFPGIFAPAPDMRISLRAYPSGPPWSESNDDIDSNECTVERVMACRCLGTHKPIGQMLQLLQGLVRRVMDKLGASGAIKTELSRLEGLSIKPSADATFLTMSQIKVRLPPCVAPSHTRHLFL